MVGQRLKYTSTNGIDYNKPHAQIRHRLHWQSRQHVYVYLPPTYHSSTTASPGQFVFVHVLLGGPERRRNYLGIDALNQAGDRLLANVLTPTITDTDASLSGTWNPRNPTNILRKTLLIFTAVKLPLSTSPPCLTIHRVDSICHVFVISALPLTCNYSWTCLQWYWRYMLVYTLALFNIGEVCSTWLFFFRNRKLICPLYSILSAYIECFQQNYVSLLYVPLQLETVCLELLTLVQNMC